MLETGSRSDVPIDHTKVTRNEGGDGSTHWVSIDGGGRIVDLV